MNEPPKKVAKVESKANRLKSMKTRPSAEIDTSELLEKDLPLLSNIEEVTVLHYIVKLKFLMKLKIVEGSVIIFVKPTRLPKDSEELPTEIILDCCSLEILKVWALDTEIRGNDTIEYGKDDCFTKEPISELNYKLTKWSLRIYGFSKSQFPSVIRIDYKTSPKTPSLYWRPTTPKCFKYDLENENKVCVYTAASPVNNRGLFPCQEPPSAMATWECYIIVPYDFLALTTSDEPGVEVTAGADDLTCCTFYSFTKHKLPMSTFAIVVGKFPIRMLNWIVPVEDENLLPVRLFSLCEQLTLPKLIELHNFVTNVLKSAKTMLGQHPFGRLDLVFMPSCFHVFGFANPHMTFLSPILLTGEESNGLLIYSRIAHEIAHSWFGLAIGALDWAEEWLSEGFATFMEDILYKEAMTMLKSDNAEVIDQEIELKVKLRLHTLQQELGNELAGSDLKVLVPDKPNTQSCKNGLVPLKHFNHVHYLKGYFFLKHLSSIVGEKFLEFLKSYVAKFSGNLVTSRDFLTFYYEIFEPQFSSSVNWESMESLEQKWFFSVNLPEPLHSTDILELSSYQNLDKSLDELCDKNILRMSAKLSSSELILFFEKVLAYFEDIPMPKTSENSLRAFLNFTPNNYNPEVIHRWCEIILKFYLASPGKKLRDDSTENIKFISEFLISNPPMGVYLYGELMISENVVFQNLARNLYRIQIETLDFETKHVLEEMIF